MCVCTDNLDYQNDELARFMRYSINNLGDPFVTSNYGVHSRQFEVAVVDFFAKLWKASTTSTPSRPTLIPTRALAATTSAPVPTPYP